MNNLMIFEGHDVEVFELNGQVLFNPYHVGECLELGNSAVKMAIAKMNEKQVVKLTNSKVNKVDFRKITLIQERIFLLKVVCISWYSRAISPMQKLS